MLFRFRLEELQDFIGHFIVGWKRIEVRPRGPCSYSLFGLFFDNLRKRRRLHKIKRRRLGGKREAIAVLEGGNVFQAFISRVADFQKVGFEE